MRNLILLALSTLLYTSCTMSGPKDPEPYEIIANKIANDPKFESAIKDYVRNELYIRFRHQREDKQKAIKYCRKVANCLNMETYLSIDEQGRFICSLLSNDREVSCDD